MRKTVLLLFAMIMAMTGFAQSKNLKNTITPAAGETWWGYFTDADVNADNFGAFGFDSQADYNAAIKIEKNDPIMGGATIKAMRLWLNSTTIPKITSLQLWVGKILQSHTYVQDVDISTLTAGANDIAFTTPYVINNANCYIGFTMTLDGQDYPIMCGGEYENNSFMLKASVEQTSWGSVSDHGKLALQVLAEGVQLPQNNAIITTTSLGTHNYQIGDEATLPIQIRNKGANPISSVTYTITTNNDPSTATPEVTVALDNIPFNEYGTINVSFDTSEAMSCTKTVTITKVNGEPNEAQTNNCTVSGQFNVVAFLIERTPVVEEFTGTWCGWCPRGFVAMELARETYGDRVVLIAAHNGDPMEIEDYNPMMNQVSGFPSSKVNRTTSPDPHPTNILNAINNCINDSPDGKVDITAQWSDEAMTKIDVETSTMFAFAKDNANYGVALVITQDGMHGTGSSWRQSNYYSGQSGDPYMEWWYTQGSYVTGLTYNFVAVAAWELVNGFNGSVNSSFDAGEVMKFNYVADISAKTVIQDKSQLKVIALLIDRSNRRIINAGQTTISPYEAPVVPSEFYMVGTFNGWNQEEGGGRLVFAATENEGIYEAEGTLEAGAEFKIITPKDGGGWTWYGGQDDNNVGYFLINNDLLNAPLTMVDGANFRIENGGNFTFRINAENMTLTVVPEATVVVPGDVDGDGVVTTTDVTLLYNVLLNDDNTGVVNGDQDGDGVITTTDITMIYNILLGAKK